MKKLVLLAVLLLALVFTAVACDKTNSGDDTTVADTTVETPTEESTTEAPTEEATTEAPTEAPSETEAPAGGCGSVIGFSAIAVLAAAAAAVALKKD